jgi:hypothetical protein
MGVGSWVSNTAKGVFKNLPVFGGLLNGVVAALSPTLEDEIRVEVRMMPGANRQTAYYLATSLAFSFVKSRTVTGLFPPAGTIYIEYDITSNTIVFVARFSTGTFGAAVDKTIQQGGGRGGGTALMQELVLFNGPKTSPIIGSDWQYKSTIAVGVPADRLAPTLSAAGQVILTTDITHASSGATLPSFNPAPPGDYKSNTTLNWTEPGTSTPLGVPVSPEQRKAQIMQMAFAALSPNCPTVSRSSQNP